MSVVSISLTCFELPVTVSLILKQKTYRDCADPRSTLTQWSDDVIKDPGSFYFSASPSTHLRSVPLGSSRWLPVAVRKECSSLLASQRTEKPLSLVLSFQCNWASLSMRGSDADDLRWGWGQLPLCLMCHDRYQNQIGILSGRRKVGNSAGVGTNSEHYSPQGPSSACAQSHSPW